jgi:hypothetical protein
VASAVITGTPLADQLAATGHAAAPIVDRLAQALAERLGDAPCRNPMSALVVAAPDDRRETGTSAGRVQCETRRLDPG